MEATLSELQSVYRNSETVSSFLTVNKNMETKKICQVITETSPTYDIISVAGGKYILLCASDLINNSKSEITTYIEVEEMDVNLKNKIYKVYNCIIAFSLVLILLSMLNIIINIIHIDVNYSIATVICASIICLAIHIDKINFKKEIHDE